MRSLRIAATRASLAGFSGGAQAGEEGCQVTVPADCGQGRHGERASQRTPAALKGGFSPPGAAFAGDGCKPCQGGDLAGPGWPGSGASARSVAAARRSDAGQALQEAGLVRPGAGSAAIRAAIAASIRAISASMAARRRRARRCSKARLCPPVRLPSATRSATSALRAATRSLRRCRFAGLGTCRPGVRCRAHLRQHPGTGLVGPGLQTRGLRKAPGQTRVHRCQRQPGRRQQHPGARWQRLVGPQPMRATGAAPIQRKSCAMPRARVGHPQCRAGRQGMDARDGLPGRQFRWQSQTFVIPVLVLRALRPCLRPGRGERQERSLWQRFPEPAPATVRIPPVRGDGGHRPPGPTPSDDRICKTQRDKRPTRRALRPRRAGRWPFVVRVAPVLAAASRTGGGNAVRFLFPPGGGGRSDSDR